MGINDQQWKSIMLYAMQWLFEAAGIAYRNQGIVGIDGIEKKFDAARWAELHLFNPMVCAYFRWKGISALNFKFGGAHPGWEFKNRYLL